MQQEAPLPTGRKRSYGKEPGQRFLQYINNSFEYFALSHVERGGRRACATTLAETKTPAAAGQGAFPQQERKKEPGIHT